MSNSNADTCFKKAVNHAEHGDLSACMQSLHECLQHNHYHLHALSHLAWLLSHQGEYRNALKLYARMLFIRPWSIEIHLRAWQCLYFWLYGMLQRNSERNSIFKLLIYISNTFCFYLSYLLTYVIEMMKCQDHFVSQWMGLNHKLKKTIPINDYEYYKISEMKYAVSHLRKTNSKLVLDLGSGRSAIPAYIALQDKFVIAAELDESALRIQRQLSMTHINLNLHAVKADFLSLPMADNTLDAISIISTIEHVPNEGDMHAMREFNRVLKPGGTLLVTVPVSHIANEQFTPHTIGHVYQEYASEGSGYLRLYNPEWIRKRLIEPSGLHVKELKYIGETSRWGWLGLGRNFTDHKQVIHPHSFAAPFNLLFSRELDENDLPNAYWAVACINMKKANL